MEEIEVTSNRKVFSIFIPKECDLDICNKVEIRGREFVPVVHGKWICGDDMFEYAICSCCKWDSGEAWEYAKKYFIYCPNCGAKMDGKEQGDGRN